MPSKKDTMYEHYFTLLDNYKKKFGEKVMLFYQVGTFYEVYGLYDDKRNAYLDKYNDSNNLNKILECHVALKKNVRYKGYVLSMAGYPLATPLSKNIPKLTELGWTVPVWKQSKENKKQRYEFNIFSAGTSWFNDTNKLSNCFTVLWLEKYPSDVESTMPYLYCGLANIDIFTGKSNLFQFKYSNNKVHNVNAYEDIERFNSIYKPKEIIFIHNYENENDIKDIIQWTNLTPKKMHIISMNTNVEYKKEIENCQKQVYVKDVFRDFFPKYDFFQLLKSTTLENYPLSQYQ